MNIIISFIFSILFYFTDIKIYIFMYISMCLYITINILLWVLSIYPFIKHYTIVSLS